MFGKIASILFVLLIVPGIAGCSNPVDVLEKKADQGSPSAMVELGLMYYHGEQVEKDPYLAAHWFQKASDQDYPQGYYWLGVFSEKGIGGINQDDAKAIACYKHAADQDHLESILRLAHIYENGELDQSQDENAALQWYQKAVSLNHTVSQKDVDRITAQIEANQLQKEESIRKEKAFEAGLSQDKIKVMIAITPEEVATAYQTYSTNPSVYYSEAGKSFEYLPGRTWQSVDGSAVTFYVTNLLKYTNVESVQVTVSGKTLKREDDLYVWPVTSDSKTVTLTNLMPGESRKMTLYFETEVDLQSKGGTLAGIGAGLSNALAKAGKAAGNKGFRVAMDPVSIRFDLSNVKGNYVGDFDEKLLAVIDAAKDNFKPVRVENSLETNDGHSQWDSNLTLPYTSKNSVHDQPKYNDCRFYAKIVSSDNVHEGRITTTNFINILERTLGNGWIKRNEADESGENNVIFNSDKAIVIVSCQRLDEPSHYNSDLHIVKKKPN